MKKIKNIVFDFGGVLIDWNPTYLYKKVFADEKEMNYFLEQVCTSEWNMKQDAGRPLAVATMEKQREFPEYEKEIALFYGRWDEMLGGEIKENSRWVEPLSKKYPLYGLTNWSAETIPVAYERYGFFKHLKGIVVSGEEKLAKPDSEIYRILLKRYALNAEESLFIDDTLKNIEAAQALGFKTIHCTPDLDLGEVLKKWGII